MGDETGTQGEASGAICLVLYMLFTSSILRFVLWGRAAPSIAVAYFSSPR